MSKTDPAASVADTESAVCWGAIMAGAFAAAAVSLILATLGAATGLALVDPWSGSSISADTFKITVGAYLVLTAIISSAIGGYMAGRLRTKWAEAPRQEVLFRDTAHGMVAWAFATFALVAVLGSGAGSLISAGTTGLFHGAEQGATASSSSSPSTDYYLDMLLRPAVRAPTAPSDPAALRREASLIFARAVAGNSSDADRTYLVQLVAQRSGLSQQDAEKRISDVLTQTKSYLDSARKYAIALSLWVTLALVAGAFAAAAAAIEGGQLRDGRWRGVVFAPRDELSPR